MASDDQSKGLEHARRWVNRQCSAMTGMIEQLRKLAEKKEDAETIASIERSIRRFKRDLNWFQWQRDHYIEESAEERQRLNELLRAKFPAVFWDRDTAFDKATLEDSEAAHTRWLEAGCPDLS